MKIVEYTIIFTLHRIRLKLVTRDENQTNLEETLLADLIENPVKPGSHEKTTTPLLLVDKNCTLYVPEEVLDCSFAFCYLS
jgi:hypothetical protein